MGQAIGNGLGDVFNKSGGDEHDQFSPGSKIGLGALKGALQGYGQQNQQPQPVQRNPYFYGGQ